LVQRDAHYPTLYCLDLTDDIEWRSFSRLFLRRHPSDNINLLALEIAESDYEAVVHKRTQLPHAYLLDMIDPRSRYSIGARYCIIETNYVDRESSVAFSRLYSRAFKNHSRRALRFHFLPDGFEFANLISGDCLDTQYRGFIVLSPDGKVSKALLSPPASCRYWTLVPACVTESVNLAGVTFRVTGSPFAQQDGRLASCASAAMWMSTRVLAPLFHHDTLTSTMIEISDLATRNALPLRGRAEPPSLKHEQLLWALHELGYEPLLYDASSARDCRELIYSTMTSGIAPILIFSLPHHGNSILNSRESAHSVTVFGYTYDGMRDVSSAIEDGEWSTSLWSPHFLLHDDQKGPYLQVSIENPVNAFQKGPWLKLHTKDSPAHCHVADLMDGWYKDAYLLKIVIPMPPRHVLSPVDAAVKGQRVLSAIYASLSEKLDQRAFPKSPVYRSYLISSNLWKRNMLPESVDSGRPGLERELSSYVRGQQYPKYVWLFELFDAHPQIGATPLDRRVVADVVLDPTSNPEQIDFVSAHVLGAFLPTEPARLGTSSAIRGFRMLESDAPYQPFHTGLVQPPRY